MTQELIVDPAVVCEILQVEESELDNHQLAKTLTEFIKQKEEEDEKVVIDAYKKVDDNYLVHLSGDLEVSMFTFASVPGSELAKAMNAKEGDLQSKMNEKIFANVLHTTTAQAAVNNNKNIEEENHEATPSLKKKTIPT